MQLPYLEYAAHQIVLYTFERTDSDCSVEVVEFVSVDDQFLAVIASVCLAWEGQGLHEMLQSGTTRGLITEAKIPGTIMSRVYDMPVKSDVINYLHQCLPVKTTKLH